MKKLWQNKRKAEGKPCDRPNIIMNSAVQVCWEKAARYFDVEEKYVFCAKDRFVIDPKQAVDLIDENTIGVSLRVPAAICADRYGSAPSSAPRTRASTRTSGASTTCSSSAISMSPFTVRFSPRSCARPVLTQTVDAASGGFVAPFIHPNLLWDFRCVRSATVAPR